jgi:hypothetical protein
MTLVAFVMSVSVLAAILAYITGWNHGYDFRRDVDAVPQKGIEGNDNVG